jgi:adenylate kinase
MDLVLLGAPGAGKGTQASLLGESLPFPRVSSGDLFRAALADKTALGLQAKAYMDRGELVPDLVTIAMVAERVGRADCAHGVIFDGFPRTVAQAEALDGMLGALGRKVDLVVYIRVAANLLLERLAGRWTCPRCARVYHRVYSPEKSLGFCDDCTVALYQRDDDTPATQTRRIAVYMEQTAPLQEYYRQRGRLVEVDGERDIAGVHEEIARAIAPLMSAGAAS